MQIQSQQIELQEIFEKKIEKEFFDLRQQINGDEVVKKLDEIKNQINNNNLNLENNFNEKFDDFSIKNSSENIIYQIESLKEQILKNKNSFESFLENKIEEKVEKILKNDEVSSAIDLENIKYQIRKENNRLQNILEKNIEDKLNFLNKNSEKDNNYLEKLEDIKKQIELEQGNLGKLFDDKINYIVENRETNNIDIDLKRDFEDILFQISDEQKRIEEKIDSKLDDKLSRIVEKDEINSLKIEIENLKNDLKKNFEEKLSNVFPKESLDRKFGDLQKEIKNLKNDMSILLEEKLSKILNEENFNSIINLDNIKYEFEKEKNEINFEIKRQLEKGIKTLLKSEEITSAFDFENIKKEINDKNKNLQSEIIKKISKIFKENFDNINVNSFKEEMKNMQKDLENLIEEKIKETLQNKDLDSEFNLKSLKDEINKVTNKVRDNLENTLEIKFNELLKKEPNEIRISKEKDNKKEMVDKLKKTIEIEMSKFKGFFLSDNKENTILKRLNDNFLKLQEDINKLKNEVNSRINEPSEVDRKFDDFLEKVTKSFLEYKDNDETIEKQIENVYSEITEEFKGVFNPEIINDISGVNRNKIEKIDKLENSELRNYSYEKKPNVEYHHKNLRKIENVVSNSKKVVEEKLKDNDFFQEYRNYELYKDKFFKKDFILLKTISNYLKMKLIILKKQCELTDVSNGDFLVAIYIKPWFLCNSEERIDLENTILLNKYHALLFIKGAISFDDNGEILFSNFVKELIGNNLRKYHSIKMNEKKIQYMKFHRKNVFLN
ncbi:MAG: hypothetical protein HPAVJP_1430 [Candidatus Hepatoplasma vulgare]|nr:MAG: hypothetical protein HPAVJP_1430 [Candidatus Hepatoplasma sp.]